MSETTFFVEANLTLEFVKDGGGAVTSSSALATARR
jgi:hypothetical protein